MRSLDLSRFSHYVRLPGAARIPWGRDPERHEAQSEVDVAAGGSPGSRSQSLAADGTIDPRSRRTSAFRAVRTEAVRDACRVGPFAGCGPEVAARRSAAHPKPRRLQLPHRQRKPRRRSLCRTRLTPPSSTPNRPLRPGRDIVRRPGDTTGTKVVRARGRAGFCNTPRHRPLPSTD